jgi:hypothetical protein
MIKNSILQEPEQKMTTKQVYAAIDKVNVMFPHSKSVWSIFEVVDKMDEVAVEGDFKLVYKQHWGAVPVFINLPTNPTWKQLQAVADEAIEKSGDGHHVFIEAFIRNGEHLELLTGS